FSSCMGKKDHLIFLDCRDLAKYDHIPLGGDVELVLANTNAHHQLADGTYHWHLSRGYPVRDEHGRIEKWFGTATDIESVKQAEEKIRKTNAELEHKVDERTRVLARAVDRLEEQSEVLRSIVDNIPVMLAFYDSNGNISFANREMERLLGWSQEEMREMDLEAAMFPDPVYRREVREQRPQYDDPLGRHAAGVVVQCPAFGRLTDRYRHRCRPEKKNGAGPPEACQGDRADRRGDWHLQSGGGSDLCESRL
ncbi:MAG TPA: PAS domain S-box protein, partial [Deltaproteobacteria bacterium]|nr:PAS domain S-box protein [Deltaproteobacteria bacterium]